MKRLIPILIIGIAIAAAFLSFNSGPRTQLTLVSGSENKALEPIIQDWASSNRVDVTVTYLGSVDISREIAKGTQGGYDAVWPANSIWIELGDTQKVVKHSQSILRSPVVLGLKRSIAEDLGWIGRDDITIQMIQAAARDNRFRLAMTSATQSNSGASAYIGFLYALAGDPDVLTMDHLQDDAVLADVRNLLGQVDRSSGSSGWLGESFAANPDVYDAMMNYEAVVLETNQALTRAREEPLYIIYPANGLSVADSPLGYVNKGDAAKEEAFQALQAHLLTKDVQDELFALGRRAGLIGLGATGNARIWNADWGVDLDRSIAPVPVPASDVIGEALRLYQTELRKPSLTIWVLDVSGSMRGEPIQQLKNAMRLLLDPEAAAVSLLQPSRRDITMILPFNNAPARQPLIVEGNDPAELRRALGSVQRLEAGGGTDLYRAIDRAMDALDARYQAGDLFDYLPAVVAMTDGASETAYRPTLFRRMDRSGFGRDVPVHAIAFGEADEAQLKELSEATIGRLFSAGSDLAGALRKAKGYN